MNEHDPDLLRRETEAAVYDDMYAGRVGDASTHQPYSSYDLHYRDSHYYPLWSRVCDEVQRSGAMSILEVGCGSGSFAHMLFDRGTNAKYLGFDFSAEAVAKARRRTGRESEFVVSRAEDNLATSHEYDSVVCLEVLEHIERDLDVVRGWRPGVRCICSVPNFDQPDHVRFFLDKASVRERYGELIDIERIQAVPRALVRGRGWKAYFRHLIWSRDNPRKLLGMLGWRTFENVAGWLVFTGTRKA